jgi:hypothetical protein
MALDEPDDEDFRKDNYLASFARAEKQPAKQGRQTIDNASIQRVNLNKLPPPGAGVRYFCPALVISRYPYKYMRGADAVAVAQKYFDGGKFWGRKWTLFVSLSSYSLPVSSSYFYSRGGISADLPSSGLHGECDSLTYPSNSPRHYIHPPADISLQPLLLIPRSEVQQFFELISHDLRCSLYIPSKPEMGALLPFENDGTPQPQLLGMSESRATKEALERSIPPQADGTYEAPAGCAPQVERSFAAFKAKIEAAIEASRRKSKAAKRKKHRDTSVKLREWCRSLKRLECYLGFRPRLPHHVRYQSPFDDPAPLLPLDLDQLAPFPFADEPIFVCIDIEANEKMHEQITEIGVSTLDTLDLVGVTPGPNGANWMSMIRSRHFRIAEYSHVVNSTYLAGCPERFEFGESEWISIEKAGDMVDSCFLPPYSATPTEASGKSATEDTKAKADDPETLDCQVGINDRRWVFWTPNPRSHGVGLPASTEIAEYKNRPRNIILVGHNITADITYLRKLDCKAIKPKSGGDLDDPFDDTIDTQPKFLETLDTDFLYRVLKRDMQGSSLGKVLLDLGLTGWNLHNAGNDARYTMEAMIGIALKSRMGDVLDDVSNSFSPLAADHGSVSAGGNKDPVGTANDGVGASDENASMASTTARELAWKEEVDRRAAAKANEAATRVREECSLWGSIQQFRKDCELDLEDIDGGAPPGVHWDKY